MVDASFSKTLKLNLKTTLIYELKLMSIGEIYLIFKKNKKLGSYFNDHININYMIDI